MSPYEVSLLAYIDSNDDSISFKKTTHLTATLCRFSMANLIEAKVSGLPIVDLVNWKTTKLGRIVCDRLYSVSVVDVKFCEECGQVLPVE